MNTFKKVKIGDVCTITKGVTGIQKAVAGIYPMVTLAEERTTHNEFQFDCDSVIIPLVSSTGHGHASMKRVHYQKGKFALGSILCAVTPNDPDFLNPKYLHIYLSYLKDKILVPLMRGAANVTLSISNIKTVEVIVPPIERQIEIIELEKVLRTQKGKLDEQNLFQQSHLTLLRRQILQDAISGKLTTDWRAQNPDTEPASKLLDQIKAEKEKLIAEKKIKKEKSLPKIAVHEVPFGLPEGWEWCRLGEIIHISSGDFLSSHLMAKDGEIPVFGGNGINGYHDIGNIDEEKIVIGRVGAYCGCVHLTPKKAWITDNAFTVIYPQKLLDKDWLILLLKDMNLGKSSYNGAQPVISGKRVYPLVFPLAPRAEQRAIVAKVEGLMRYVSQLEEKIANNANNAEILMQAFLGEVFKQ